MHSGKSAREPVNSSPIERIGLALIRARDITSLFGHDGANLANKRKRKGVKRGEKRK